MTIKIYWRQYCSSCEEVFRYLDQKELEYEKIDVTHDQVSFNEMLRLGGIATPFIVIGQRIVPYFDKDKFNQTLEEINNE